MSCKFTSKFNKKKNGFAGHIPAGIGLIVLAYAPNDIYIVETILILICLFKISSHCGFHVRIAIYKYISLYLMKKGVNKQM